MPDVHISTRRAVLKRVLAYVPAVAPAVLRRQAGRPRLCDPRTQTCRPRLKWFLSLHRDRRVILDRRGTPENR